MSDGRALSGQVAVVTGASRGIGRATALELALQGAAVVLTAMEADLLDAAVKECRTAGVEARGLAGDLDDPQLAAHIVDLAVAELGQIDVVVNNAFWEASGTVLDVDLQGWDRTMRVCLTAAMLIAQRALPHMIAQGSGSIVNVSSQRAVAAGHALVAYETAKAGLVALTRSIAVDFGPKGVRCNCVSPGLVLSERVRNWYDGAASRQRAMNTVIPLGRGAEPVEVARVIAFVASPEASYINGATIAVDGGSLAGLPENAALGLLEADVL